MKEAIELWCYSFSFKFRATIFPHVRQIDEVPIFESFSTISEMCGAESIYGVSVTGLLILQHLSITEGMMTLVNL